jgi:signal transduction histidine kinase
MKRKLNIAFLLISLSLIAIVIFQLYWSVNAYRVNKSRFNSDIDLAMQRAMDDCKKDYFDSVRRVLVKHLAPPLTFIQLDTPHHEYDTAHEMINIRLLQKAAPRDTSHVNNLFINNGEFSIKKSDLNYYRKKIDHPVTMPKLVTEISFYRPDVMQKIIWYFISSINPVRPKPTVIDLSLPKQVQNKVKVVTIFKDDVKAFFTTHKELQNPKVLKSVAMSHDSVTVTYLPNTSDSMQNAVYQKFSKGSTQHILHPPLPSVNPRITKEAIDSAFKQIIPYQYPPNYRREDSLKLLTYFTRELKKMNVYSPFDLHLDTVSNNISHQKLDSTASKTSEYNYRYHGFRIFNIVTTKEFFVSASFSHTSYTVVTHMLATLILSGLLIVLTAFCFAYVIRIILQQKKLAELKDDFINNMTHELKTPIATISVAIEGLQKFNALNDAEKTQRYLQTSRNELNRLNDLVTKVLNIATFENRNVDILKVPIDLDELINDVIATEQTKAVKTVNITYTNKSDVKYINADGLHFRNLLVNLVDNAAKYSGDLVTITVTCYRDDANLYISIKDDGIGIAAANISQVFDKFYRVPTGNIHNVKGTGLGLSYVKYIAEAHGGQVQVKSEINTGTEFIVSLPLSNG